MNLSGKRVLVVGLGESGLAMARWLDRQGACVRVVDSRATPPNAEALCIAVPAAQLFAGGFSAEAFADLDLVAISPGVPLDTPAVQAAVIKKTTRFRPPCVQATAIKRTTARSWKKALSRLMPQAVLRGTT